MLEDFGDDDAAAVALFLLYCFVHLRCLDTLVALGKEHMPLPVVIDGHEG